MSHTHMTRRLVAALLGACLLAGCGAGEEEPDPLASPPVWTITRADLGGDYATAPTEEAPLGIAIARWGEDACGANGDVNDWANDTFKYGGAYENRQIADHPDHPFTLIVQMTGDPLPPVRYATDVRHFVHNLWKYVAEICASPTRREDDSRLSFEVLGTEPGIALGDGTPLFGWRAVMQGPWEQQPVGDPPRTGDHVHIEVWYTLVDETTLIVAGTQSAQPPTLNARGLLDTVARRVHKNPPDPRWTRLNTNSRNWY